MSIYSYTVNSVIARLLPPILRQSKHIAWICVLGTPARYNVERMNKYFDGDGSPDWLIGTSYMKYFTVRWNNNAIYESKVAGNLGIMPTGDPLSDTNWRKVQDSYIGLNERVRYNGQLIVLQYALNRHFRITSAPFIYVESTAPAFNVFVPLAVYNTLAGNNTDRNKVVEAFCNKYRPSGGVPSVASF